MLEVQKIAFTRLISVLSSIKAEYKIILPDGTEYGTLEVSKKGADKPAKVRLYPHGDRSNYMNAILGGMSPGDVISIPTDVYPIEILAQAAATQAHRLWGKGNSICRRSSDKTSVEVMRTA